MKPGGVSAADDGRVAQSVQGNTISAFMGRREIGFPKQVDKPRLLQRSVADLAPPKHWTQEQIEEHEERDLVLHNRAPGTWLSYTTCHEGGGSCSQPMFVARV